MGKTSLFWTKKVTHFLIDLGPNPRDFDVFGGQKTIKKGSKMTKMTLFWHFLVTI